MTIKLIIAAAVLSVALVGVAIASSGSDSQGASGGDQKAAVETGADCPGGSESAFYRTASGDIEARYPCGARLIEPDNYRKAYSEVDGNACLTLGFRLRSGDFEMRRFCDNSDPLGAVVAD